MTDFLKKHKMLCKLQFEFRENHSPTVALIEVLSEIHSNLDSGKFVLGVFLDIEKAFDTTDHKVPIHKLEHYGLRGLTSKWLTSYSSNRKQYTCINGENSEIDFIINGVPQGSVLGPLLLTINVNDNSHLIHSHGFLLMMPIYSRPI